MGHILKQDLQNILEAYTYIAEGDVIGRAYRQVKSDREYGNIEKGDDLKGPYSLYKQAQDRAKRLDRGYKGRVPVAHTIITTRAIEAGVYISSAVERLLSKSSDEISVSVLKDWHMAWPGVSCIVLKGFTSNLLDWYPVDAFTHTSSGGEKTSEYALSSRIRKFRSRPSDNYDEGVVKIKDVDWKTFSIYMEPDLDMNFYMGDFFEAKKILESHGLKLSNDPGQILPVEPDDADEDW
jgi:hypothetical protein